jgi:DNA-binding response OmpR family regulator
MAQTVEAFKDNTGQPSLVSAPVDSVTDRQVTIGSIGVDFDRHEARVADRLLDLTPTEFDTLAYLVRHAERVVSCRDMVQAVHGYETTEHAARPVMRVHIHRLRQKIEADAAKPEYLLTIRSAGYMLVSQPRGK